MKKLTMALVVFFSIFSFLSYSQISSTDLLKQRQKEIEKVIKQKLDPETEGSRIDSINSFYERLTKEVLKKESFSKPEKERSFLGQTSLSYNGNQGTVYSRNSSVTKSAEAYSTMAYADANLIISKKVAESISTDNNQINTSNYYNYGFEGAICNRYRYQKIDIKIKGIGNNYDLVASVDANETFFANLLPGSYIIYAKGERQNQWASVTVDVKPGEKDFISDNGKAYVWGANVGVSSR